MRNGKKKVAALEGKGEKSSMKTDESLKKALGENRAMKFLVGTFYAKAAMASIG